MEKISYEYEEAINKYPFLKNINFNDWNLIGLEIIKLVMTQNKDFLAALILPRKIND